MEKADFFPPRSAFPLRRMTFFVALCLSWTAAFSPSASALPAAPAWRPPVDSGRKLPVVNVAEGFHHDRNRIPSAIAGAWPSVFQVLIDLPTRYQMGTAFLVGKIRQGDTTSLYFVTSHHVVNGHCPLNKKCPKASLSMDVKMKKLKSGLELASRTGTLDSFEVLEATANPDLALLRVRTKLNVDGLTPLRLAAACELQEGQKLYTIGFPTTHVRTSAKRVKIPDQALVIKRWSEGLFLEEAAVSSDEGLQVWARTTVDALGGNSGGPLLNEDGEVVGVVKNSAALDSNAHRYDGNEDPASYDWHSNAVPCVETKDLLSKFNL